VKNGKINVSGNATFVILNARRVNREADMADNKKARGKADRSKVAKGEGYEVSYFARKHGITNAAARKLIDRVGNDREKLNKAAAKVK
jgi:hypothetical protein